MPRFTFSSSTTTNCKSKLWKRCQKLLRYKYSLDKSILKPTEQMREEKLKFQNPPAIRRKRTFNKRRCGSKKSFCDKNVLWHSTPKCKEAIKASFITSVSAQSTLFFHASNNSSRNDIADQNWWPQLSSDLIKAQLFTQLWMQEKLTVLGSGTFGKVFLANLNDAAFAIKLCPKPDADFKGEKNCLQLNHLNVVKTHFVFDFDVSNLAGEEYIDLRTLLQINLCRFKPKTLQIVVMEYAGSQSLQHLLDDSSQTMNASLITNICSQISSAIKFCHNNSVVHLDLKPSNIIISPNFICKLVDFGCSQKLSGDNNHIVTVCDLGFGTPAYTAPEIFEGLFPTEKCDIYSFGIMMWQLVTRQSPYANMAIDTIIYRVVAENLRPQFPDEVMVDNPSFSELAFSCWHRMPARRPSADQIYRFFSRNLSDTGYHSFI